jgi:hypothetical protein
MKIYLGVKGWLVGIGIATVAAAFLGLLLGTYAAKSSADPPVPCSDQVRVDYDQTSSTWVCDPPSRASVQQAATVGEKVYFIYRCTCPIRGVGRDEVVQIVGEALGAHESWLGDDDAGTSSDAGPESRP